MFILQSVLKMAYHHSMRLLLVEDELEIQGIP